MLLHVKTRYDAYIYVPYFPSWFSTAAVTARFKSTLRWKSSSRCSRRLRWNRYIFFETLYNSSLRVCLLDHTQWMMLSSDNLLYRTNNFDAPLAAMRRQDEAAERMSTYHFRPLQNALFRLTWSYENNDEIEVQLDVSFTQNSVWRHLHTDKFKKLVAFFLITEKKTSIYPDSILKVNFKSLKRCPYG